MKKILLLTLLLTAMMHQEAARAESANANATMKIIESLAITKIKDLEFGTSIRGTGAETISPSDARAATFQVTGQPNNTVTIVIPSNPILMSNNGGTTRGVDAIEVSNFQSNPSGSANLNNSGLLNLKVGASRSNIPTTQTLGDYIGTFDVAVSY